MRITPLRFKQLTGGQLDAWSALQRANSAFASPFLRPEFCHLVAGVRPNVEVGVIENGQGYVGFWPYERDARNVAHPIGLKLNDYQGVIAGPGLDWCTKDLIEQCGLTAWSFDHLAASQQQFRRFHWSYSKFPVIELSAGFDEYYARKRREGSTTIKGTMRKLRKLERDVGRLRFVPHSNDRDLFDTVIEWKRAQYRRLGSVDCLGSGWIRTLLQRIANFRTDEFSGMLSAVYAGEHLIAAHLGMRSRNVLHGWFPVYNREFERYSPGLILWLKLMEQSAKLGIQRIDLGEGSEPFKQTLKTGDIVLADGAVDLQIVSHGLRKSWWWTQRLLRNSPLGTPLRSLMRSVRGVTRRRTEMISGSRTMNTSVALKSSVDVPCRRIEGR